MWDLIVTVPDHCLSFYFGNCIYDCTSRDELKTAELKVASKSYLILPFIFKARSTKGLAIDFFYFGL